MRERASSLQRLKYFLATVNAQHLTTALEMMGGEVAPY